MSIYSQLHFNTNTGGEQKVVLQWGMTVHRQIPCQNILIFKITTAAIFVILM
jgi:hypothetical protein